MSIRTAIVGYGNIGRYAREALLVEDDFELAGVVRREASITAGTPPELRETAVVSDIDGLGDLDVALLAVPTRLVEDHAVGILRRGVCTVDSFDIHGKIADLVGRLDAVARDGGAVAMVSCGWDPGTDSVIRAMLESMAPRGITYTDFGPGMSMGHTVALKRKEGIRDALSVTIPRGTGLHRRMVYIELEEGVGLEEVKEKIMADPYFAHDETVIQAVEDVNELIDHGHAVDLARKGVSGQTQNQLFRFEMKINNPALTSQVMVSAARAAMRQEPGAYTMIDIPPVDYLPGARGEWISRLV